MTLNNVWYWRYCQSLITICLLNTCLSVFAQVKLIALNDTPAVINIVKRYLPAYPVIVEAGAFDGTDTVALANQWPAGRIHAFEPLPMPYIQLVARVTGKPNIRSYQLALGEKTGISSFFVSTFSSGSDALSSSLLEPKEHVIHHPEIEFKKTIPVATVTLDDWARNHGINEVHFLWLDLQGYELNVLKASPLILKTVKVIFTEVEFIEAYKNQYLYKDVLAWMNQNGFVEVARDFTLEEASKPTIVPGDRFWGNCIFVRA
jgi:2-O-methyltransferase